jgi:hypothetical protein
MARGRGAHAQLGLQHHLARIAPLAAHALQQHVDRQRADALLGLRHGGERRAGVGREFDVVEADDRELVGHVHAAFMRGA